MTTTQPTHSTHPSDHPRTTASTATRAHDVPAGPVVIVGGAGKTGQRVAERLASAGVPARFASRSTHPSFDWEETQTWRGALSGARAAYVAYQPDLAVPGADARVGRLAALATELGLERLVLLSGRGEEGAEAAEQAAFAAHDHVTVCRVAWFAQNLSEGMLAGAVPAGAIAMPVPGAVPEPFIDLDDVADVVVRALLDDGHTGLVHELTGPESLTLVEVAQVLSEVTGRELEFVRIPPRAFVEGAVEQGLDHASATFLAGLFEELLDGRNVATTTGVRDVLGREPRSFRDWATATAARGTWDEQS